MIKNPKITKYVSYVLILVASISLILVITQGDKLNVSPFKMFLQIAGCYFFGFYFLWNSEEKPK